jgi:hypothetical protein
VWPESNEVIVRSCFGIWSERRCGGAWGAELGSNGMGGRPRLLEENKMLREEGGGFWFVSAMRQGGWGRRGGGGMSGTAWRRQPTDNGLEPAGAHGVQAAIQSMGC